MRDLFYVIGASGVGKDSLLNFARSRIEDSHPILFAHRYITRPAELGGENHIALSHKEFVARQQAGLFALSWQSHNQLYGIGKEIDLWMSRGFDVVVNGSRQYLSEACEKYPSIKAILIQASPEVIRSRLAQRGREDSAQIDQRIKRSAELKSGNIDGLPVIWNDGPMEEAGQALIRMLLEGHTHD